MLVHLHCQFDWILRSPRTCSSGYVWGRLQRRFMEDGEPILKWSLRTADAVGWETGKEPTLGRLTFLPSSFNRLLEKFIEWIFGYIHQPLPAPLRSTFPSLTTQLCNSLSPSLFLSLYIFKTHPLQLMLPIFFGLCGQPIKGHDLKSTDSFSSCSYQLPRSS